ncbi:hypothetical protein V6Z11_D05G348400 [Gossypium hirsutum]
MAEGFSSIPNDSHFFLLASKNIVVAVVPTIPQSRNKVGYSFLVQNMYEIFDPVNASGIIPSEKPVIEITESKNSPSCWAVFEGMDEGFCTRTTPREILPKVLTNRGDLGIHRK